MVEQVIQVDLLGVERIARTRAISNAFQGMATLLGIPFLGEQIDYFT